MQLIYLFLFSLIFAGDLCAQQIPQSNAQIQLSFAPVVKKSAPAVVNIFTTHKIRVRNALFNDPFFSQFFIPPQAQEQQVNSLGSGVIISSEGLIITSLHVVRGADDIRVSLNDKREFSAKIITEDAASDLALIQLQELDGEPLPKINIVDSDNLEVGDLVLAIGNPFGVGQTVTSGIISGLARSAKGINDYNFFIQTDAAINPGNSGGALVNMNGDLIGINSAIYSKTGGSVGVGFAIPANMVRALLKNRKPDGKIIHPYFGASFQDMNNEIARSLGLKRAQGVLVQQTEPNSPAEKAGIIAGDVIISFNQKAVDSTAALHFRVETSEIGVPINLQYIRQNKINDVQIILGKSTQAQENEAVLIKGNNPLDGVEVITLTPKLALHLGITSQIEGVVVTQISPSKSRVFVRAGDIITECNGAIIRTSADLQKALKNAQSVMSITLIRGGNIMQLRISN